MSNPTKQFTSRRAQPPSFARVAPHCAAPRRRSHRWPRFLTAAATLALGFSATTPDSNAADVTWTGSSGAWETPSNWNTATPPVAGDNALFPVFNDIIVTGDSTGFADIVFSGSSGKRVTFEGDITGTGSLRLNAPVIVTFAEGASYTTTGPVYLGAPALGTSGIGGNVEIFRFSDFTTGQIYFLGGSLRYIGTPLDNAGDTKDAPTETFTRNFFLSANDNNWQTNDNTHAPSHSSYFYIPEKVVLKMLNSEIQDATNRLLTFTGDGSLVMASNASSFGATGHLTVYLQGTGSDIDPILGSSMYGRARTAPKDYALEIRENAKVYIETQQTFSATSGLLVSDNGLLDLGGLPSQSFYYVDGSGDDGSGATYHGGTITNTSPTLSTLTWGGYATGTLSDTAGNARFQVSSFGGKLSGNIGLVTGARASNGTIPDIEPYGYNIVLFGAHNDYTGPTTIGARYLQLGDETHVGGILNSAITISAASNGASGLILYQTSGVGQSISGTGKLIKENATSAANIYGNIAAALPNYAGANTAKLPAALSTFIPTEITVKGGTLIVPGRLGDFNAPVVIQPYATLNFSGGATFGVLAGNVATYSGNLRIEPDATLEFTLPTGGAITQRLTGNVNGATTAGTPAGNIVLATSGAPLVFAPAPSSEQLLGAITAFAGAAAPQIGVELSAPGSKVTFTGGTPLVFSALKISYSGSTYAPTGSFVYFDKNGASLTAPVIEFASTGTGGMAAVFLKANQLGASASGVSPVLRFSGAPDATAWVTLNGYAQTIGGLESGTAAALGNGGLQNTGVDDGKRLLAPVLLTLDISGDATATHTFNGVFRDGDGDGTPKLNILKTGGGTQRIGGIVNLTGQVTVSAGALEFFSVNGLSSRISAAITVTGGTLGFGGASDIPIESDIVVNAGAHVLVQTTGVGTAGALRFTGKLSGGGDITLAPATASLVNLAGTSIALAKTGALEVQNSVAYQSANGATSPNWVANQGILRLGANGAFDLREIPIAVSALEGSGTIFSSLLTQTSGAGNTLTVGVATVDTDTAVFAGTLAAGGSDIDASKTPLSADAAWGALTLKKIGAGKQILSGLNAAALTEISTGTLQIGDGTTNGTATGAKVTLANTTTYAVSVAPDTLSRSVSLIAGPEGGGVPGDFEKLGGGDLLLLGKDTRAGLTIIKAGTLRVGSTALPATGVAGGAFTILPLGDEVTAGFATAADSTPIQSNGGYRGYLWELIKNSTAAQFVGEATTGATGTLTTDGQTAHAGVTGEQLAYLLGDKAAPAGASTPATLDTRLAARPDAILLQLGANDIRADGDTATRSRLTRLAAKVATDSPETTLFIATLLPTGSATNIAQINTYNEWLRGIFLPAQKAAGAKIVLVEIASGAGFPASALTSGPIPDNTGYSWIAAQWYAALLENLGVADSAALNPDSRVDIQGGVLDINNKRLSIASLTGNGGGIVILGSGTAAAAGGTLVFVSPSGITAETYAGVITGNGGIVKQGAGSQILAGDNIYTGATIVENGTLIFAFDHAPVRTSRLEVAPDAVLDLGVDTTKGIITLGGAGVSRAGRAPAAPLPTVGADILGSVTLNRGHTLDIGPATGAIGELAISGDLSLTSGSNLRFEIENDTVLDKLTVAGFLTFDADSKVWPVYTGTAPQLPAGTYDLATAANIYVPAGASAPQLDDHDISVGDTPTVSRLELTAGDTVLTLRVSAVTRWFTWTGTGSVTDGVDHWDSVTAGKWIDENSAPAVFPADSDAGYYIAYLKNTAAIRNIQLGARLTPVLTQIEGDYTLTNTYFGYISGNGRVEKLGAGTLVLQGDSPSAQLNDYTGRFAAKGGTVILRGPVALLGDVGEASLLGKGVVSLLLSGGASLVFDGAAGNATTSNRSFTIGEGGASIIVTGANANTSVNFNNSDSSVQLDGSGPRALALGGAGDGALALQLTDSATATLSVVKTGAGTWRLSGDNSFSGGLTLSGGVLSLAHSRAAGSGVLTLSAGELNNADGTGAAADITLANAVALGAGAIVNVRPNSEIVFAGTVSGNGTDPLFKTGTGTLVLAAANPALSGVNIEAGTVRADADGAFGASGVNFLNSAAVFGIGATNVTVRTVTGTGTLRNDHTADATLTFDIASGVSRIEARLADGADIAHGRNHALSIGKTGAGTLELAGRNNATGAVSVSEGILKLASPEALAATGGLITVSASGTFDIAGQNTGTRNALISGTGSQDSGAVLDSTGGGVFPALTIDTTATVRAAGTSALTSLAGAGTATLAPVNGAAAVFTLDGLALSDIAALGIAGGATLRVGADNALALQTAVTVEAGGALEIAAGVTQPARSLAGTGSVRGTGTLNLSLAGTTEFAATLDGAVNLGVTGGTLTLRKGADRDSLTTGTIRVENAVLVLASPLASDGAADLLGATSTDGGTASQIIFRDVKLSATAGVTSTRTLTLEGSQFELASDGATDADALRFETGSSFDFGTTTGAGYLLILSGTNTTAANVLNAPLADPSSGNPLRLVKTDAVLWELGAANTYTGGTLVAAGTLALGADNTLPVSGSVLLGSATDNATLRLNGHAQTLGDLAVSASVPAADIAENRVVNGSTTTSASLTLDIAASRTGASAAVFAGELGREGAAADNDFTFVKDGAGELSLTGKLFNTGETRAAAGTLVLSGTATPASALITVASGALLDVTQLVASPAAPGSPAVLGLLVSTGKTLRIGGGGAEADVRGDLILAGGLLANNKVTAPGSSNRFIGSVAVIDGALRVTADSNASIWLSGTPDAPAPGGPASTLPVPGNSLLAVGTLDLSALLRFEAALAEGALDTGKYTFLTYGELALRSDPQLLKYNRNLLDPRYTFILEHDAANKRFLLDVSVKPGSAWELKWTGAQKLTAADGSTYALWNGTAPNFLHLYTDETGYFQGDSVRFDNSAETFNIVLDADVRIGRVTFFNDDEHPYSVSGGAITGAGYLEKLGSGELILNSANAWSGAVENGVQQAGTILGGGTIGLGDDAALGLGSVLVSGNGTFRAVGGDRNIANNIALGNPASQGGGERLTVDTAGNSFTLAGSLTGGTTTRLTKAGTGTLALVGDTSAFAGRVEIDLGTLRLDTKDFARTVFNVGGAGAILEIANTPGALGADATLPKGTTRIGELNGGAGAGVTGVGALEVGSLGGGSTFAGNFSGPLTLEKVGAGTLLLSGDNSAHTGAIHIAAGSVQFGDGVSGATGSGKITTDAGARAAFYPPPAAVGETVLAAEVAGAGIFEKLGPGVLRVDTPNDEFTGTVSVAAGTLILGDGARFGVDASVALSGVLLLEASGEYVFPHNISSDVAGKWVVAAPSGVVIWTGSGDVKTEVLEGTLKIGDGAGVRAQEQGRPSIVTDGATLHLDPAQNGLVALGDVTLDGASATLRKTGGGTASLNGNLSANGFVSVEDGTLALQNNAAGAVLTVNAVFAVGDGATLRFARAGETRVAGSVATGVSGKLEFSGGAGLDSKTVLLSRNNEVHGPVSISDGAIVQLGDAALGVDASLGSAPVTVEIGAGATLRVSRLKGQYDSFTKPSGEIATVGTGTNLSLTGTGVFEFEGAGDTDRLDFNAAAASFAGTLRAANGLLVLDAATLPADATLDATADAASGKIGGLRVETAVTGEVTAIAPALGTGRGRLVLSVTDGAYARVPVLADSVQKTSENTLFHVRAGSLGRYEFANASAFGGTLAVDAATELHLTNNVVGASELRVYAGGALTGNGTVAGNLLTEAGGIVKPGNSAGRIDVRGDFVNAGLLVIDVERGGANSVLGFSGTAALAGGKIWLAMSEATHSELKKGREFVVLADTEAHRSAPDVESLVADADIRVRVLGVAEDGSQDRFTAQNFIAYSNGGGALVVCYADTLGETHLIQHEGLQEFAKTIDVLRKENSELAKELLVNGPDAVQNASPLGLASIYSMTVGMAQDDTAALWGRVLATAGRRLETQSSGNWETYFTGTGRFEKNGNGADNPTFDSDIFGGIAGIERYAFSGADSFWAVGANASFHNGKATIANGGGRVKQDNARLAVYGAASLLPGLSATLAFSAGHNNYDVRHNTVAGTAKGSTDGFDFSTSLMFGYEWKVAGGFALTPYLGAQYTYVSTDDFAERGTAAALEVAGLSRDSLSAKVGVAATYSFANLAEFVPQLKIGLDLAYARELLDDKANFDTRLASDVWRRVDAAALSENVIEIGPSLDVSFGQHIGLQFGYRFKTDFSDQTSHSLNATLRVRF
jgi:autotransporter-associated beta strand protein